MAENYTPWRLPPTLTPETSSFAPTPGESCPVLYPEDRALLDGLPSGPVSYTPPNTQPLWTGGTAPPQPPITGWVTERGDQIRYGILVTNGPKTVRFYGRHQTPDGTVRDFQAEVTGNSASTLSTLTTTTAEGQILDIYASAVGGVGAATIYLIAELGHTVAGTWIPRAVLLTGMLTDYGVAPPTVSAGSGSSGGGGCCCTDLSYWSASNPGGNWSQDFTPAANTNMRLVSLNFVAQTSATAGNRQVAFWVTAFGGFDVVLWNDPNYMAASLNWYYYFNNAEGSGAAPSPGGTNYINLVNPCQIWFDSTFYLNLYFNNKKAGDTFYPITAIFETRSCA